MCSARSTLLPDVQCLILVYRDLTACARPVFFPSGWNTTSVLSVEWCYPRGSCPGRLKEHSSCHCFVSLLLAVLLLVIAACRRYVSNMFFPSAMSLQPLVYGCRFVFSCRIYLFLLCHWFAGCGCLACSCRGCFLNTLVYQFSLMIVCLQMMLGM